MSSSFERVERPFERGLVVVNPVAGRGLGARMGSELSRELERAGVRAEVFHTGARGQARERVAGLDPAFDLLVCVGGDGTLGEIFAGLGGRPTPVGVLPLGTANVLGLDLCLPRRVSPAVKVMLERRVQRVDLASAGGRSSFLVTGVGLDAMTVRELERRRRGPIRKASYLPALWAALRDYRQPRLAVELDGQPWPGTCGLVLISNVVHYGGVLRLSRSRALDDGLFEVYLFPSGGRATLLRAGALGALVGLPRPSVCHLRRAREIRVTSPEPVPYQVDGDYGGTTPLSFEVTGAQARVLVPSSLS
jgi:diacylglycerol kinase family enzyme